MRCGVNTWFQENAIDFKHSYLDFCFHFEKGDLKRAGEFVKPMKLALQGMVSELNIKRSEGDTQTFVEWSKIFTERNREYTKAKDDLLDALLEKI